MDSVLSDSVTAIEDGQAVPRSSESLGFETVWRRLPKSGLLPERKAFKPSAAPRFLPNIVLIEVDFANPRLLVRLVGSAFEARIQRKIDGMDYLDFLPPRFHEGAMRSIKMMADQPCGLWQVMALHYERNLAEPFEVTCFPFAPTADGKLLLLNYARPLGHSVVAAPTSGKALMADSAMTFAFLDIGGGVPAWPAA